MTRTQSPRPSPSPSFAFPPTATLSPRAAAARLRRAALHTRVREARRAGRHLIAGVDEAGAGPLAGPLVACAVLLHPRIAPPPLPLLDDSKRLSAARRSQLYHLMLAHPAFILSFASRDPAEIDHLNILNARMHAMADAVRALPVAPDALFVDGNRPLPDIHWVPQEAVVAADATISVVAMASIFAKVTRDSLMKDADLLYPGYGFAKHFGYPTKVHREKLKELGPCPIHRRSFRPVREAEATRQMHA